MIPASLKERKQWLIWRFEKIPNKEKLSKVPYYAAGKLSKRYGQQGSDHDRQTLVLYDEAVEWQQKHGFDGIGFAFLPDDGLIGIDLDGCYNCDNPEREKRADSIIAACNSYTELSPSGKGVHIICQGFTESFKSNALGIEVFCGRQFFTFTGQPKENTAAEVNEVSKDIIEKLQRTVKGDPKTYKKSTTQTYTAGADANDIEKALSCIPADCDYFEWIEIGMAIKSQLDSSGYDLWDRWSASAANYPGSKETLKKYNSFKANGGVKIGTLYHIAKTYGYRPKKQQKIKPGVVIDVPSDYEPKFDPETGEIIPESTERSIVIDIKNPLDIAKLYVAWRCSEDDVRTLHRWRGDFYIWNGIHYVVIDDEQLDARLYHFLASCQHYVKEELQPVAPNTKLVKEVWKALMATCRIDVDHTPCYITEYVDDIPANDLVACANGFLSISQRKLFQPTPRLFITAALDFDAAEEKGYPFEWHRFLLTIFEHDEPAVEAMAEVMGYLLTDQTEQQKAFMICGPRRSGKGTILRVLEALVGSTNKVSPSLSSLGKEFGLQPLVGKRVAMISDARLSFQADQSAITENILRITGEDTVSVPRKHKEDWHGKLPTKFIIATNELPNFSDSSSALSGRFIMFQLVRSFYGDEKHDLTSTLLKELPQILHWALDGLERLRARGKITQTASGKLLADEFEQLTNPMLSFVEEECRLGEDYSVLTKTLYQAWCDWCKEQGRDHPGSADSFGKKFKAAFPSVVRKRLQRNGPYFYLGIRLLTNAEKL